MINKYDYTRNVGAGGAHNSKSVFSADNYNMGVKNKKEVSDASIAIPEMEGNPEIVYNIKLKADLSNIQINKLTFGDVMGNNNFGDKIYVIPLNIILCGSHNSIVNFLKLLENDKRICEINDVFIKNINADITETNVNVSYFCTGGE